MTNDKISVIIPCYNGWHYMNRCLENLEKQTVAPYEVIVVDDCSKDDSYERLQEYAAQATINVVVLRNANNVGPGASRKKAIDASTGDYIAFCDCDDWFEIDFVESMIAEIQEKNPDVIAFDNYSTYENRKFVAGAVKKLEGDKKTILANVRMSLCRLCVKREVIMKTVFPPLYYGEDGAVVPQIIAKAETFSILDKPFYNYYFREGSASQRPSPKACAQMVEAFAVLKRELPAVYRTECEYIGIKRVCYGAILCGFKTGVKTREIRKILNDFEKDFPNWMDNPYRANLAKIKNIYLFLIKKRCFFLVKMMTALHSYYVKFRKG